MLRTTHLLALAALTLPMCLSAQIQVPEKKTVVNALGQTIKVSSSPMVRTGPLRDKPPLEESNVPPAVRRHSRNEALMHTYLIPDGETKVEDLALQKSAPSRMDRAPIEEWQAQTGNGTPPDPTGAAGPNHYVQCVNSSCRVYTKTGTGMGGAFSLNSLFPGQSGLGDPIVLYDRHADRWFISQMKSNGMSIAISETNDPTGDYFAYNFSLDDFPDYPKFSIWWDGYYMTSNSSNTALVFEREKMLLGQTAQMEDLSAPSLIAQFRSLLPADADGDLPPAGTPCYFFNLEDNGWGAPADRIKIYEMHTDWVNIANTEITVSMTLNTVPFDTNFGSGFSNISQPGTTQKLDAVSQIFYFRAPHLRFVGHSSVVLCHVVDVNGANRAGVRWYELRDANDGNWYIYQQGTWAPDAAHRWMASIAMDNQGNIGLGYSHTDPATTLYPGLRFTGRYASDPLGSMTLPEQVIIAGGGAQTNFDRYGDYSHMSLDPNGTTFWHTGEYLTSGGAQRTRIASFDLVQTVGLDEVSRVSASGTELQAILQGDQLLVSAMGLPEDGALTLDLIAMDGRTVLSQAVQPTSTRWNGSFDIAALPPSAYFVRLGRAGFQKVQRIVLTR